MDDQDAPGAVFVGASGPVRNAIVALLESHSIEVISVGSILEAKAFVHTPRHLIVDLMDDTEFPEEIINWDGTDREYSLIILDGLIHKSRAIWLSERFSNLHILSSPIDADTLIHKLLGATASSPY